MELPLTEKGMPLWHDGWDALWQAAQETRTPIHLHTIGGRVDTSWVEGQQRYLKWLAAHMTCFQLSMATHLSAIIFGGALERFPGLVVVMAEAGLGWIPYLLERMDYEWEDQFQNLELTMKPSDYWRRQMYASFQQDETGLELLDRIGADRIMWGSDFPHPDGVWPDSQSYIDKMLGHLPEATRRAIVYETAAGLYGFPRADAGAA